MRRESHSASMGVRLVGCARSATLQVGLPLDMGLPLDRDFLPAVGSIDWGTPQS